MYRIYWIETEGTGPLFVGTASQGTGEKVICLSDWTRFDELVDAPQISRGANLTAYVANPEGLALIAEGNLPDVSYIWRPLFFELAA